MKKNLKKIFACALASIAFCGAFSGCKGFGGDEDDEFNNRYNSEQKASMTELKIGVYNGGIGYEWAKKMALQFEEMYKDYSFESGKKGVYVNVIAEKEGYEQLYNLLSIGQETNDVYYLSDHDFTNYVDLNKNVCLAREVTDILQEKVYKDNGELAGAGETATKSMLDKQDSYFAWAWNEGTETEPVYYAFPYEYCLKGFIYDHDAIGQFMDYDGWNGTPKTTDDFLDLLDRISDNYTGITFAAQDSAASYTHMFQYGFVAQYEGEAGAMLNLTYDGTCTFEANSFSAEDIAAEKAAGRMVENADGTLTATITDENAWLLSQQTGKKKLAEFVRNILKTDYIDSNIVGVSQTYSEVQKSFLFSAADPTKKRIAMIFEGEWWENEARTYFDAMGRDIDQKYAYGNRDFRFMPIPQAEGGVNAKYTMLTEGAGHAFVNKNTKVYEAAKKWIQFQHSESSLKLFLQQTGCTLPYDFEMSESDLEQCTPFAASTYQMKQSDEFQILHVNSNQPGLSDFAKMTTLPMSGYGIKMRSQDAKGKGIDNLFKYMANNLSFSSQAFMEGMAKIYNRKDWTDAYNEYQAAINK